MDHQDQNSDSTPVPEDPYPNDDSITVEPGSEEVERNKRLDEIINRFARDIVAAEPDPVKAREILEGVGIFEDPESFRT